MPVLSTTGGPHHVTMTILRMSWVSYCQYAMFGMSSLSVYFNAVDNRSFIGPCQDLMPFPHDAHKLAGTTTQSRG